MKHFLLTGLLATAALGMAAQAPQASLQTSRISEKLNVTNFKNTRSAHVRQLAPGVSVTAGQLKKMHIAAKAETSTIARTQRAIAKASATEGGYALYEGFEGWDGEDNEWTPAGWSVEMKGEVTRDESWSPATAFMGLTPADGNFMYGINYSSDAQDEWLISPAIDMLEGYSLTFWAYIDPSFIFSMDNIDWETMEYIGGRTVAATLQVWAQPEGEEWTMLHDYADDYKDLPLNELFELSPEGLEKKNISLSSLAGKKAKIAFRYVGCDGNTMLIDAVGVGFPQLDDVAYMDPFCTLYWGFTHDWQLTALQADIAMYPVFAPITWTNNTYIDEATFTWTYCDPATAEFVTTEDPYELTVTYEPDYSSEATMRNNFFYPPTLTATAPGATPGSYTAPYTYFQAGGKMERTLNDGTEFTGTLLPFGVNERGITFVTCDDETIGDPSIPVFGHSEHTDLYWLNYTLNGNEPTPTDHSRLLGIANLFYASEAPIVVNGISAYGWGKVADDAEFKATIYGVNEEWSTEYETFTPIASATLKGSKFLKEYDDDKGYLCMPFEFAEPAVVQATEKHPAYFIMLEGFNSDKVEYFAPLQSAAPDPNNLCFGYILNHIDMSGQVGRDPYYSLKQMVYREYGKYNDLTGAFAIGLDAEYPWLTTDTKEIELPADGSAVQVKLGSYYDGSRLTVEAPAGVEAAVEGRYDKCVLTVRHNAATVIAEGNLTVKGPGVELSIPVKESTGISDITADGADHGEITGIYDLGGRRIEGTPAAGIYVVRYSDGTAAKQAIR